jgi:lipopolysaccharide transport system ATP-binding protein
VSTPAIRTRGLGKRYRIHHHPVALDTLRDAVTRGVKTMLARRGPNGPEADHVWALRNVDLDIEPGDVVGIIGPNGAGKSTLLRILSRITEPTEGYADIRGRVGSLLEIGTGFNSELTGRENVYLNGAILGMRKATITRKFDEIVDFAGVERFLDTPLKHYSNGMQLRLAFAIAAHLEPEIVLVDEVLTVGDVAFQQKCMGKIGDVAAGGRTVLLVSHNMAAVRALCREGLVITQGSVTFAGAIDKCIESYYRSLGAFGEGQAVADHSGAPGRVAFGPIALADGPGNTVRQGRAFALSTTLAIPDQGAGFKISCVLQDVHGRNVFVADQNSPSLGRKQVEPGVYRISVRCPALWLQPGVYSLCFRVKLWTTSRSAQCQSESFPLDIAGANGTSDAILHPDVTWTFEPATAPVEGQAGSTADPERCVRSS